MKVTKISLRPINLRRRASSRLAAVQFIFELEHTQNDINEVINDFVLHFENSFSVKLKIKNIEHSFFIKLVYGVYDKIIIIDEFISKNLVKGWKINRLPMHELSILRVAIYELIAIKNVPYKSIIVEYTDIADSFNSDVSFINAILDKAAKEFR